MQIIDHRSCKGKYGRSGWRTVAVSVAALAFLLVASAPVGADTIGTYREQSSTFRLRNANSPGPYDTIATFGVNGDQPAVGDWNGDGQDSIGVYRPANNYFSMQNNNVDDPADPINIVATITDVPDGGTSDQGVIGDWNGDGVDSIGVYLAGKFYLRNSNSTGLADLIFDYAPVAAGIPVAGDWNGDGVTTVGVYDPSQSKFYLRNSNTADGADLAFVYGIEDDLPVAGDWNGDGVDTVGIYRPSSDPSTNYFHLNNENDGSSPEISVGYGTADDLPVVGRWVLDPPPPPTKGSVKIDARFTATKIMPSTKPRKQKRKKKKRKKAARKSEAATQGILVFGQSGNLSGHVRDDGGEPVANVPIVVESRVSVEGAPWSPIASATTDGSGGYEVKVPPGPSRLLRVTIADSDTLQSATSNEVSLVSEGKIEASIRSAKRLKPGQKLVVKGKLYADGVARIPPNLVMIEQRETRKLLGKPHWVSVPGVVKIDSQGRFRWVYQLRPQLRTRELQIKAVTQPDPETWPYERAQSDTMRFTALAGAPK